MPDIQPANHAPQSIHTYQYWAQVEKVVDGDTMDLEVDVGFRTTVKQRFRLVGIDTPEIFGVPHDSDTYRAGLAAKKALEAMLPASGWVEVKVFISANREKYGRYLGEISSEGRSLNQALIDQGHGMPQ